MSKNSLVLEILAFVVVAAAAFFVPGVLAWNDALAISDSSDPFFAGNVIFGFTVYFGIGILAVGGVAAVVVTAKEMTCPKWMVPAILACTPSLTKITNTANTANEKENVMPLFIATITTLVILVALVLFPVSAFAATTTAMEPVMPSNPLAHILFYTIAAAAIRLLVEDFMKARKIKALTAALATANRRADKAEAQLEEANACLETSNSGAVIAKLTADNAQLVTQTTWLSTLANNLSKIVAGVTTTLVALFFAVPAHAAAPWQFAADAGQLPDLAACAAICALVCGAITAVIVSVDCLIRKAIKALTNITTSATAAITLENLMPVLTMLVLAILAITIALFPSCANAATSITMNADGLNINILDNAVLSYLAWILGSSLTAMIGAIVCELIVRHTRTIAKLLGLVAVIMMIPSVADAAELVTTTTATVYAIIGAIVAILGLLFIGGLTVCRHELEAGITVAFSIFLAPFVAIVGTEIGIDKATLEIIISGILVWVALGFVTLQLCMLPGRKADKAAEAVKKAEWNMIIRQIDEAADAKRYENWFAKAERANNMTNRMNYGVCSTLSGKAFYTYTPTLEAISKATGTNRALWLR
jgi:hypothetical protein